MPDGERTSTPTVAEMDVAGTNLHDLQNEIRTLRQDKAFLQQLLHRTKIKLDHLTSRTCFTGGVRDLSTDPGIEEHYLEARSFDPKSPEITR